MSATNVPSTPDSDDVRDRVRERFGARSNDYRTSAVHSTGEDLEMLVKLVGAAPGTRALDIATGAGHTALALAQAGADVVASDITPAMLGRDSNGSQDATGKFYMRDARTQIEQQGAAWADYGTPGETGRDGGRSTRRCLAKSQPLH